MSVAYHWEIGTKRVLLAVLEERRRQVAKYGLNTENCDGTGPNTRWLLPFTSASATEIETNLRADYENFEEEHGHPSWVHLVREELAEAFAETDPARLEAELLQVAALCVSWVERLRERQS